MINDFASLPRHFCALYIEINNIHLEEEKNMVKEYPDYSNLRGIELVKMKGEIFRNLRFNILKRHVTEEEYYAELRKYNIDPKKRLVSMMLRR